MRFAYSTQQKVRIAMLLFCVMTCTILIRILEDKSVQNMNASFVSMYNDRLIPATDLFYVSKHIYAKRSLIETALHTQLRSVSSSGLAEGLASSNSLIDSLIRKYEKTFLVAQEKKQLRELKGRLADNLKTESQLLSLFNQNKIADAANVYGESGIAASDRTMQKLAELMTIQTSVGKELVNDSAYLVSGSKLYSTLQIALAIVIGILIVGIVFTSNVVKISNEKYHLN